MKVIFIGDRRYNPHIGLHIETFQIDIKVYLHFMGALRATVTLVTMLRCRLYDVDSFMLLTESLIMIGQYNIGDSFNFKNRSPKSLIGHQYLKVVTISNIRHQYRRSRWRRTKWSLFEIFLKWKMTVGHSATAFRNFAIRQLSIPQNDIRQRDQMAKIFRKKMFGKMFAINYSEKRHSETFIPKISIRQKI